jgi:hypothetical protein
MKLICPYCKCEAVYQYTIKDEFLYICRCYKGYNSWRFKIEAKIWFYWLNGNWINKSEHPKEQGFIFR